MKDLTKFYMRVASALERTWTSREVKCNAAILLRNAAVEMPHCHFCGYGEDVVNLYESRYNPKARICKQCACYIVAEFAASAEQAQGPSEVPAEDYRRDSTLGPRRSYDDPTTAEDYRRDTALASELKIEDLGPVVRR
jgi:hypothetical protein